MNILEFFDSAPFMIIGCFGLVALIIAAVLDGLFDALDFGDGPVSLTTVAAFIALFGFTAAGLEYVGVDTTVAVLLAAVAGVFASVGAWQLSRFFQNQSTSASHSTASLVGAEGVVRLRVQEFGVGEIALRRNGHLHTYTAKANTAISEGTPVVITSVISDTLVFVKPKDEPTEVVSGDYEGVTEKQIQDWADEAEQGYNPADLNPPKTNN